MSTTSTSGLRQVGEVLIDQGVVSPQQIEEALAAQKQSPTRKLLGEVLVELGYCSESQILEALAAGYDLPFARITPKLVDPAAAVLVARKFAEDRAALPLFLVDGTLTVAVAEPANVFLAEDIAQDTGHEVQCVACPRADILACIEFAFRAGSADTSAFDEILAEAGESQLATAGEEANDVQLQDAGNDSPVVRLVQQLIVGAVREGASDIHIEPSEGLLRIRYRVDGRLYEKMKPPASMTAAITARIKILASLDIAERRLPQDGAIRVQVDDRPIDLRVSTLPNKFGEKVVMRILDTQNALVDLRQLGMDADIFEQFNNEIHKPHGIVLVTGPTGSGKSTTLYSALSAIISIETNICTVEDPVEYNLSGINQFQVHERIGLTFPAMLRSLLRQDPDIVMIGEIRDPDTAKIAVQAALTGHLVLSTLHTNDSVGAATRLQNLGVEPFLVSAAVESVLAQRLVRRICPDCRVEIEPQANVKNALSRIGFDVDKVHMGRGCVSCHQAGTKGRIGIYELFVPNEEIRDAITTGASLSRIRELAVASGIKTLLRSGLAKAEAGETSFEEILRVTIGMGAS